MNDKEARELLIKYRAGKCTPEETVLVETWYLLISKLSPGRIDDATIALAKKNVWDNLAPERRKIRTRRILVNVMKAAAVIAIVFGLRELFIDKNDVAVKDKIDVAALLDTIPGGKKAILQLANGQQIDLGEAQNRILPAGSGLHVTQSDSGRIVYQQMNYQPGSAEVHILKTPKDGQYQLILSDGTRVYLNTGSSLTYPAHFASNERRVHLSGEGYFEVAENAKQPFIVTTKEQTVKVLGTHFNIRSYDTDTVRTTLVTGKVNVIQSSTLQNQLLKPGVQALLTSSGILLRRVDAASLTAWKNGRFVFNKTPIKDALIQISDWYHVKIDYDRIPETTLTGSIKRDMSFHDMLNSLESMGKIQLVYKDKMITTN